jgi:hypothetical protein
MQCLKPLKSENQPEVAFYLNDLVEEDRQSNTTRFYRRRRDEALARSLPSCRAL